MKTDTIHVFAGNIVGVGRVVEVVTVISEDGRKWLSEAFVFVPKLLEEATREIVPWDRDQIPSDIPPELLTIDESFMLGEGRMRAAVLLSMALEKDPQLLGKEISLTPANIYPELAYVLERKKSFILELKNKTKSKKLQHYLSFILGFKREVSEDES